jgi:predicted nucleic acid-binding protein
MNAYSILIDSSVWIEYFRTGRPDKLDRIIEEGLVCINELILSELVPPLILKKETDIIEGLKATEMVPMNIDWDIIRDYQVMNLRNGINRVGIPDLIILQQVIDQKITLYSFDKHFKLMQNHLNFDLISE